jgi:acetolactate synthase-1/3 small subunit
LLLRDEWGGLQRVLGLLTKKRVRVDTLVCGKCEFEGHSRLVISSSDDKFPRMLEHLRKLHDVVEAEAAESPALGYSLVRTVEERLPWPGSLDLESSRALASGSRDTIAAKGA